MSEGWQLGPDDLASVLAGIDEVLVGIDDREVICFVSSAIRDLAGEDPARLLGRPIGEVLRWGPPGPGPDPAEGARPAWRPATLVTPAGAAHLVEVTRPAISHTVVGASRFVVLRAAGGDGAQEAELLRRLDHEQRLTSLATAFVQLRPEEFDEGVERALADLCALPAVDRASVWRLDTSGDAVERTHVHPRVGPGSSLDERTRRLPIVGSKMLDQVRRAHLVRIDDPSDLTDAWHVERTLLGHKGVRSLLAAPLVVDGVFGGFLSLVRFGDGPGFDAAQEAFARSAASLFAEAFARDEAERELLRRARRDPLTGLANRWAAVDGLREALARLDRSGGVGVLLFDLDRFQAVNDALGPATGDSVLCAISERLRAAAPEEVLVARLGGDEVLVVVEGVGSAERVLGVARELQMAIDARVAVDDHDVFVTASVGAAHVAAGTATADRAGGAAADLTPEEVLGWVDTAMYRAKARGRNRVEVFDDAMRAEADARLRLARELRVGLATGAFEVHLQPEVDLRSGAVISEEAFVRWRHPERGLLDADRFISVAGESDLVVAIGRVVLDAVCGHLAARGGQDADPGPIRVNVSARELVDPGFVPAVVEALDHHGVDPSRLVVELSERALMEAPRLATEVLRALDALGAGTSLDGFGVGHSSLAHLSGLPLGSIGIDRSFAPGLVGPAGEGPDRPIVAAMVDVVQALGRRARMSGVETAAQQAVLEGIGCDSAQGYHFGRPAPPAPPLR